MRRFPNSRWRVLAWLACLLLLIVAGCARSSPTWVTSVVDANSGVGGYGMVVTSRVTSVPLDAVAQYLNTSTYQVLRGFVDPSRGYLRLAGNQTDLIVRPNGSVERSTESVDLYAEAQQHPGRLYRGGNGRWTSQAYNRPWYGLRDDGIAALQRDSPGAPSYQAQSGTTYLIFDALPSDEEERVIIAQYLGPTPPGLPGAMFKIQNATTTVWMLNQTLRIVRIRSQIGLQALGVDGLADQAIFIEQDVTFTNDSPTDESPPPSLN